jgi:hypothetical protein
MEIPSASVHTLSANVLFLMNKYLVPCYTTYKTVAFQRERLIRSKIVLDEHIGEQVNRFNCAGCDNSLGSDNKTSQNTKISKYDGKVKRILNKKLKKLRQNSRARCSVVG